MIWLKKNWELIYNALALISLFVVVFSIITFLPRGDLDRHLGFVESNGFPLNETHWWRQKSHLINTYTYVSVDFDELYMKAVDLRETDGDCLVCYDSENGFIWVLDTGRVGYPNAVYYWYRDLYSLA